MRQKWSNGLYWLTGFLSANALLGSIEKPFWRGYPESSLYYYLVSAAFLLLSILLFYLIWRSPHLKRWEAHMQMLALASGCLAVAYTGWTYAPAWGLAPLWGHVLGLVVGFPLGLGIALWENREIKVRRGSLLVEQHGALDA